MSELTLVVEDGTKILDVEKIDYLNVSGGVAVPSPVRKINLNNLPWKKFSLEGPVEFEFRDPGRSVGSSRIGLRIQKVYPGKQSSRLHRHMFQEEILLIISGIGYLRHGDEKIQVKSGDCINYHAGDDSPHTFVAEGKEPLVIYAFGERVDHEVCLYPEVGKAFVEGLDKEVSIAAKSPKTLMKEWKDSLSR